MHGIFCGDDMLSDFIRGHKERRCLLAIACRGGDFFGVFNVAVLENEHTRPAILGYNPNKNGYYFVSGGLCIDGARSGQHKTGNAGTTRNALNKYGYLIEAQNATDETGTNSRRAKGGHDLEKTCRESFAGLSLGRLTYLCSLAELDFCPVSFVARVTGGLYHHRADVTITMTDINGNVENLEIEVKGGDGAIPFEQWCKRK